MVRNILVVTVLAAAAAWAGVGNVAAEFSMGCVCSASGAAVLAYTPVSDSIDVTEPMGGILFVTAVTGFLVAWPALGVWETGELVDSPSGNPGKTWWVAFGYAGLGLGTGILCLIPPSLSGEEEEVGSLLDPSKGESPWIWAARAVILIGAPALATVGYNVVKEKNGGGSGGLSVTPTVAALPPQAPGEAPTLTFGVAAAF